MLEYCYTHDIEIDDHGEGLRILALNERFKIYKLTGIVMRKLLLLVTESNIWTLWSMGDTFEDKTLSAGCGDIFGLLSDAVIKDDAWLSVKADQMIKVLGSVYGFNLKEEDLFNGILKWIKHQREMIEKSAEHRQETGLPLVCSDGLYTDEEILKKDLASILKLIRFPMLPKKVIESSVKKDPFIMSIDKMEEYISEANIFDLTKIAFSMKCFARGHV